MTRKQAFLKAIEQFLEQNDVETATKLQETMMAMPFVKWTKEAIFECVRQFMADNKRAPRLNDFGANELPTTGAIKYVFKLSACDWLKTYFPAYIPNVPCTRKQAILKAIESLDEEAADKMREVLAEYPWCRWSEENIRDAVETFVLEYGRLPKEEEYGRNGLPYFDIFRYNLKSRSSVWMQKNFPQAYIRAKFLERQQREIKSSLKVFKTEYERLKPVSKADFDMRRDRKKVYATNQIMKRNGIAHWRDLLEMCGLEKYEREKKMFITSVELIVI